MGEYIAVENSSCCFKFLKQIGKCCRKSDDEEDGQRYTNNIFNLSIVCCRGVGIKGEDTNVNKFIRNNQSFVDKNRYLRGKETVV